MKNLDQEPLDCLAPGYQPSPGKDWTLVKQLGETGGFGQVWLAQSDDLKQSRAFKFCKDLDIEKIQSLKNEIRLVRQLEDSKSDGIVKILDASMSHRPPFIEYEYIQGTDLLKMLKSLGAFEDRMPHELATKIILKITKIVAQAHSHHVQPIVHRDLKFENILVKGKLEDDRIDGFALCSIADLDFRVSDFGIGRLYRPDAGETTRMQSTGQPFQHYCTPGYASEEQMWGEEPEPTDDVYTLGVMWFQLLRANDRPSKPTGRGWRQELLDMGLNEKQLDVIEKCFECREYRIKSAADLVSAIENAYPGLEDHEFEIHDGEALFELSMRADNPSIDMDYLVKSAKSGFGPACMELTLRYASQEWLNGLPGFKSFEVPDSYREFEKNDENAIHWLDKTCGCKDSLTDNYCQNSMAAAYIIKAAYCFKQGWNDQAKQLINKMVTLPVDSDIFAYRINEQLEGESYFREYELPNFTESASELIRQMLGEDVLFTDVDIVYFLAHNHEAYGYPCAIEALRTMAIDGLVEAQLAMGYACGFVNDEPDEGLEWYRKAIEKAEAKAKDGILELALWQLEGDDPEEILEFVRWHKLVVKIGKQSHSIASSGRFLHRLRRLLETDPFD